MKIEIKCGNCGESVRSELHCEICPCWKCLTWLYQDGSVVDFEERNRLYEENYFGKPAELNKEDCEWAIDSIYEEKDK